MKTQFALLILSLCTFFPLAVQAQSPTTPQDMPISLSKPKPPGQTGLRRPVGDGNVWTFRVVPEPGIVWVEGPNWSYPGKGEGTDPDWGQWGGGDGQMWLSWSSPQKAAPFKIRMTGKIGRPGGRGGQPIDTEASWEGEVEKKVWDPEPAITGGVMVMPQNQQLTPHLPHPVIVAAGQPVMCAVTEAIDKDTWTMGKETGEEEDVVTYEWTTSGGGFITPQNPQGTAPTAETQNTTWKAPMEPGEYILSCRIDDEPTEVPEEESGSRDDEALPVRTVKVWVVDVKFTPSTIRLYEGEARAVTATVTPEAMANYLTFTSSNPSVATVSGSAPELAVSGLNAGIAQLQALYNGVVLKTAPIIIKAESEDEDENDLDDDGIPDHEDPDKDGDGIPDDPGEHKVWTPGTGISGHFGGAERQVLPGDSLSFQAIEFSDSDRWQQGTEFGEEADTLVYSWSASGGTLTVDPLDSTKISWQAPTGGNATGLYTITLQVDDEPQPIGAEEFGSRDDSAVTFTQQIRVAQKVWSAGLALGQDRDANGTIFENGRMVLPQDQTRPHPSAIKIAPGTALDCAVETASDLDRWELRAGSYLLASGEEADSVTYQWESSGGSWVGATNAQAARWLAPAYQPNGNNSYTLKCLIDDLPTAVGSGEGGSRDDSPALVREVQVEVVSTPSRATLKLYKDEALTQELAGGAPVGGTVYAVLELQIGADEKLISHSATVQIEERYPEHGEERRLDWPIDFTATSGWQKKTSPSGAWVDIEESPMTENSGIESVGYRLKRSWNTTNTPLGHNEVHTLAVVKVDGLDASEIQFAPVSGEQEYFAGPTGISANVKNLVITDVTTNSGKPDYFKFDPDSEDRTFKNPKLSFKIEDSGDPHQYKWEVKIRSTSNEDREWTVFCRGEVLGAQQVSFNLNDPSAPNTQEGQLIYRGTFTFDITVEEYDDLSKENPQNLDVQTLRSPYLSIPQTYDGDKPGHDFYNEWVGDELHAKLDYYIIDTENKDANKVHVYFLNPEWEVKASSDLSAVVNTPHLDNHLYVYTSDMVSGDYKALVSGEDSHSAQYRDHQNKYMPAVNDYRPAVSIEFIGGQGEQYNNANWYGIWVKRKLLGNSGGRQIRNDLLRNKSGTLPTVHKHVWDKILGLAGWEPDSGNAVLYPKMGTIWSSSNALFFNHKNDPSYKIQGNLGINGNWQGDGVEFKRWSFGINNGLSGKNNPFKIMEMTRPNPYGNYHANKNITSSYPYGMGGVGALVVNGITVSPGYVVMEGDKKIKPNDPKGEYSELSDKLARTLAIWSSDGEHFFIILAQQSAIYGWDWRDAQNFVMNKLPGYISSYTNNPRKLRSGLQIAIGGAVLLDGGSHSSLVYVREKKTRELTALVNERDVWISQIKQISEHHSIAGWPILFDHRPNRTVLESYAK